MGTKNRIYLGVITSLILHHFRNIFDEKEIYITKLKAKRIGKKHPEIIHYIHEHNFQFILDSTIAICEYHEEGLFNFISKIEDNYILYSISQNNFYNELGTVFIIRKKQMTKCYETITFLNEKYREDFLKEIN